MEETKYCDILWVDDFDNESQSHNDPYKYLPDYFPDRFSFRVRIEKNFFNALVHLENNFTNYFCIVLDVNFSKGFNFDELNDDDNKSSEIMDALKSKEIRLPHGKSYEKLEDKQKNTIKKRIREAIAIHRMYEIFKNNNIRVDGAVDAENFFDNEVIEFKKIIETISAFNHNDNNFKKIAGYYLFLYLLQRRMPQNNIVMLTGNKGEMSTSLPEKFKEASLQFPKAFDRKQCKLNKKRQTSEFVDWLNKVFNSPYRFRACMVAMTTFLQKMLDDENIKRKLLSTSKTSTSKMWSKDRDCNRSFAMKKFNPECIDPHSLGYEEESAKKFFPYIYQIIVPWDKANVPDKPKDYPYFATMKTARNWLAHSVIQGLTLQTESFLFGVCMRGLFNFSNLDSEISNDYEVWENELLKLIKKLDKNYSSCVDGLATLVSASSEEICARSKYEENFAHKKEEKFIHNVLRFMGQSDNPIKCYEEDLLRAFLHGVRGDIPPGYIPRGYSSYEGNSSKDIREEYLEAIKNRLKHAITEAGKSERKD